MLTILRKVFRNELRFLLYTLLLIFALKQFLGITAQISAIVLIGSMFAIGLSTFLAEIDARKNAAEVSKTKTVKIGPIPIVLENECKHEDSFREKTDSNQGDKS